MKELIPDIDNWLAQGQTDIALATVIQTWGSAPRKAGAKMAFSANGSISGSVSGGCVEGAVVEAGEEVLASGHTSATPLWRGRRNRLGSRTRVWRQHRCLRGTARFRCLPAPCVTSILQDQAATAVTIIRSDTHQIGQKWIHARNGRSLNQLPQSLNLSISNLPQSSQRHQLSDDLEVFAEQFRPAPTLIMVGGVHIAVALTSMAKTLGFRTIVIDPRRAFGSDDRFPHADQLLTLWPQKAFAELEITPETAVALLTHDPKIDDPALEIVLPSSAFYIGALGSRKTHAKRVDRLQKKGVDAAQISRIHAPIGLDLNAQTPEEIALSVIAEVVKAYRHK